MTEQFKNSRNAVDITVGKVGSFAELDAPTEKLADEKFAEKTRELWKKFAVSGVLQFDKEEGKQILCPFTDFDGNMAIAILNLAGINTSDIEFIRPGQHKEGAINLDTGDKFGVEHDSQTQTSFFDHHAKGQNQATSTAEIVYQTMIDLGLLEKSEALDRLTDFVTKIDNRLYPAEDFLKSGRTLLGLQRGAKFENLVKYFEDYDTPRKELSTDELAKYGLKEASVKQQIIVDEAIATLDRMIEEGKVIKTAYGDILINENNELAVGASAAYVKCDGIINFTPEKSFAVTLKEKDFNEELLREKLGDKFQGKIIRGKMWIYNDQEPLGLTIEDLQSALI